jgi:sulfur transfer complex TusBCD TusB component (DsrH family)
MITIGYSTKKIDPEFIEYLRKSSGNPKVEIIPFENPGTHSLTEAYNIILEKSSNDIVVLCHDDIYFDTKNWAQKLVKHFKRNPDYGILGVAGSVKIPESGMWWEEPVKMRGIVNHEHEGKKWESKYSTSIGNQIDDVVLVDGLFIAIKKSNIQKTFDEEVKGFHLYDVDFCTRNFIEDVKVGVIYDIRVTHLSIGQTNEQWEENRKIYSEKYKDSLPLKVYDEFKNRPLKVLLGVLNFQGLTGSEVSTLELAKGLSLNGCDVSVISTTVSPEFDKICKKHNIKTYTNNNPPGYIVGDGIKTLNGPQGQIKTEKGRYYKITNVDYDVIQTNHKPISEFLLQLYPTNKFVTVVRSEVIDLENPVPNKNVKKYIAIRPSIKDYIVNNFDVLDEDVEVIYNPFDTTRFTKKESPNNEKEVILFVGTMDYLRKQPIEDLIEKVNSEDKILWLVGKDTMGYATKYSNEYENVKYFGESDKVEDYYHKCDVTAGILLGRTTIEGYLCGKPGWIYYVDKEGNIKDKEFTEVPENLNLFEKEYSINKFKETYINVYNT